MNVISAQPATNRFWWKVRANFRALDRVQGNDAERRSKYALIARESISSAAVESIIDFEKAFTCDFEVVVVHMICAASHPAVLPPMPTDSPAIINDIDTLLLYYRWFPLMIYFQFNCWLILAHNDTDETDHVNWLKLRIKNKYNFVGKHTHTGQPYTLKQLKTFTTKCQQICVERRTCTLCARTFIVRDVYHDFAVSFQCQHHSFLYICFVIAALSTWIQQNKSSKKKIKQMPISYVAVVTVFDFCV